MNIDEGLNGLAQNETKLASYHNTPFTKLCLGMTRIDVTNWILVDYTATSLYSVIADGSYHETNLGRAEWMSLLNDSVLQSTCNKEGFNAQCSKSKRMSRIGIFGDDDDDCSNCNTVIGFGFEMKGSKWSSGNVYAEKNKSNIRLETFGYIFVQ